LKEKKKIIGVVQELYNNHFSNVIYDSLSRNDKITTLIQLSHNPKIY